MENTSLISSNELSHDVEKELDVSANYSRRIIGSGIKAKKINKKQQNGIFRNRSGPKRITENIMEQLVREKQIAISSPFNIKQTVQHLKNI